MTIEIITKPLTLTLHGFSGTARNKDYAGTAFALMNKMWPLVKSNNLKNKGRNIWVYDRHESVFAGVELDSAPDDKIGLEEKTITLTKYAWHKHVGPYNLIPQVGQAMTTEIKSRGLEIGQPYIEIYGHWTQDETKLETELLMSIQ